jgi:hypothetical protein
LELQKHLKGFGIFDKSNVVNRSLFFALWSKGEPVTVVDPSLAEPREAGFYVCDLYLP